MLQTTGWVGVGDPPDSYLVELTATWVTTHAVIIAFWLQSSELWVWMLERVLSMHMLCVK